LNAAHTDTASLWKDLKVWVLSHQWPVL
jgi:hypothetical protein